MSEINGPQISVNQLNFGTTQKQSPDMPVPESEKEEPKLKDFGDPKAEALGRSMLIKESDSVNNDLKALVENPQIAENSDKMFETAFKAAQDLGIENAYEEAATFSTGSVK